MKLIKRIILVVAILITLILPFNDVEGRTDSYYSLYDDHLIMNKYQGDMGSCWSFATTRVIETSLAKKYNEAYLLSEASLIARTSNIGEGEYLTKAVDLVSFNDLSYESDFNYESITYLQNDSDNSNYKIINSYLDSIAINKLKMDDNLKLATIIYNYRYDLDLIKDHLKNYGAMMISLNGYSYNENKLNSEIKTEIGKGRLSTHALTIVGYDDTYKCNDGTVGAFILLNSNSFHEGRGILYLPYSYDIGYYSDSRNVIGVKILDSYIDDKLILTNTNTTINEAGIGSATSGFSVEASTFKDKNVFNDNVNLIYELEEANSSLRVNKLKIYEGNKDVTDLFDIVIGDDIKITNKAKLRPGTYQIQISYSYTNSEGNIVEYSGRREFYLIGGFEASFIKNLLDSVYYSFNTLTNNKNLVAFKKARIDSINRFTIYFRPTIYNKAAYYRYNDIDYSLDNNEIIIEAPYKEGFSDSKLYFLDSNKNIIDEYDLRLYFLTDNIDSFIYTNVFYLNDGLDIESNLIPTFIFKDGLDMKYYLPSLGDNTKYELIKSNGTLELLKSDTNGYYLTLDDFKANKISGGNYLTKRNSSIINRISYTIYLKPSFNKIVKEIIDIPTVTTSFIYDGKIKSPLDLSDSRFKVSGNSEVNSGSYVLDIEIIDKNRYVFSDGSTSITIPWVIEKKVLPIPNINISDTYIYNGINPIDISLSSDYIIDIPSEFLPGDYILKIYPKDNNYIFSTGEVLEYKYKIIPGTLDFKIINNTIIFNGNYKNITYSYNNIDYMKYSPNIKLNKGRVYFKALGYNDLVVDIVYEEENPIIPDTTIPEVVPTPTPTVPDVEVPEAEDSTTLPSTSVPSDVPSNDPTEDSKTDEIKPMPSEEDKIPGESSGSNNLNKTIIISVTSILGAILIVVVIIALKRKWK